MNNNTEVPTMKTCSKCKEEKPRTTDYFNKRKVSKDGFYGQCTVCRVAYNKKNNDENIARVQETRKVYYEKNRERIIKESGKYYKGNKESVRKRRKVYYKNNREWFLENRSKYYEENREYIVEQMKLYQKENPHILRQAKQRRKARKSSLPNTLTIKQWESIKLHFNNSCSYCGMNENEHVEEFNELLHQEHFVPLSNGGEYTHNNIIPSCKSCNSSKNNKDFFEWYPTHEHYREKRERIILEYLGYNSEGIQQLSIL